jgi:hypothetical protein
MKLQTQISLTPSPAPIGYDSRILLLGSCFVISMGRKLDYYKFRMVQNPFGILYHPPAIEKLLVRALQEDFYTEEELFFYGEGWHCFDAHSEMSRGSAGELLDELNSGLKITADAVRDSTHIILTLGTAWVYRLVSTAALVANCHKLPQREFKKELLSTEEIVSSLRKIIADIRAVNKEAQFIFTISPVRHLKDGFTGNQRSKAGLINAVHDLIEGLSGDPRLIYFPAYEILMDELRDYRFYEADLLHPNLLAIDYIWEKFRQACIGADAYPVMEEVGDILKRLQHRPFRPDSAAYREFRRVLQEKIAYLKEDYPHIDFER